VLFEKAGDDGTCGECGAELTRGDLLFMEQGQP
jgi:hypothetical protein